MRIIWSMVSHSSKWFAFDLTRSSEWFGFERFFPFNNELGHSYSTGFILTLFTFSFAVESWEDK